MNVLALVPLLVLAQLDVADAGATAPPMFTKEGRALALLEGRGLYLRHCATCHGERGDGKGESARYLSHPPRDFLPGQYEFRMTPYASLPREEDVFRTLTVGVLGTPMPAWGNVLTVQQRRQLSRYVLALSPRSEKEPAGVARQIGPPPPSSPEAIARGRALFTQMGCIRCHGPGGRGDGPAGANLKDVSANAIRPANLTRGFFQGGRGVEVVFRTVSTGLAGTPMISFADALDDAQRWDVAHFVMSLAEGDPEGGVFAAPAGRIQVP